MSQDDGQVVAHLEAEHRLTQAGSPEDIEAEVAEYSDALRGKYQNYTVQILCY